jgi:hypothetical protein
LSQKTCLFRIYLVTLVQASVVAVWFAPFTTTSVAFRFAPRTN